MNKTALVVFLGMAAAASTALSQSDEAKPSEDAAKPTIEVSFQIDGEAQTCQHSNVQLRLLQKDLQVEQTSNGFVIPAAITSLLAGNTLVSDPESRRIVDIRITCDNYVVEFPKENISVLAPGKWEAGIHTPLTWLKGKKERPAIEQGTWVSYADWEFNKHEPIGSTTTAPPLVGAEVPHADIPPSFVDKLSAEQPQAQGARAMDIAYALAVFHPENPKNKAYLMKLWNKCLSTDDVSSMVGICDQPVLASYIANLYWRGDSDLLNSLIQPADSPADAVEDIGLFYADLLEHRSGVALAAMKGVSEQKQHAICKTAGRDAFRFDATRMDVVSKIILAHEGSLAQQCWDDVRSGVSAQQQ